MGGSNRAYGIEGDVSGHAGALIHVSLQPLVQKPDEATIRALAIGLGAVLAEHGQFVTYDTLSPTVLMPGPGGLDAFALQRELSKLVDPEQASENNEKTWALIDQRMRGVRNGQ